MKVDHRNPAPRAITCSFVSHRIRRTSKRIRRVRLKFEVFDGFLMIVKLWHTYVRPKNTWIRADYSMVVTRLKTTRCRHEATLAPRSHLERAKRSPIAPATVAVAASPTEVRIPPRTTWESQISWA